MLIWGCTKTIEGTTIEEYSLSLGSSEEETLCDAKPEGSTEGSTELVTAPHEKNYINIHAWKNSYNNNNNNNNNNTTCPEVLDLNIQICSNTPFKNIRIIHQF